MFKVVSGQLDPSKRNTPNSMMLKTADGFKKKLICILSRPIMLLRLRCLIVIALHAKLFTHQVLSS